MLKSKRTFFIFLLRGFSFSAEKRMYTEKDEGASCQASSLMMCVSNSFFGEKAAHITG